MWIFPVAQPRQSRTVPFCLGNGAERAEGLSVLRHEQHGIPARTRGNPSQARGESQPREQSRSHISQGFLQGKREEQREKMRCL